MKVLILTLAAMSALVVAYFVTTVLMSPPQVAEAKPPATTQATPTTTRTAPAAEASKLVALLPDSPGSYNLSFSAKVGAKTITLPFRLFIPKDYDKSKDLRPLVIFLHAEEDRGTDLAALTSVGPERRLREDQGFRDGFRSLCVSPQCPPGASFDDPETASAVLALVAEMGKTYRVDPERVSLTGTGMGAAGAFRVAALDPDRFATLALNSAKTTTVDSTAPKLRFLYTSLAAAQNDKPAYETYMRNAELLGRQHADIQVRTNGDNAKNCAQWFFQDGGTWDWINSHKRRTAQERSELAVRDAKALADALAAIPKVAGEHKLKFSTWVGDKQMDIPYLLTLPRGYDTSPAILPTVMFLAGAGEVNPDLSGVITQGPNGYMRGDPKFKDWFPAIVIAPIHDNSPERARGIIELLDFLEKVVRIDPDRVSVTGYSLGGTSTWTVANAGIDRFAAVAPINARERCIDTAPKLFKYVPTWIIVGGADGDFFTGSVKMNAALCAAGDDVHLTVIPGEGHSSWGRYYSDRRFYDWLLSKRRLTAAERTERDAHPTTAPSEMLAHTDKHPDVLHPGQHWLEYSTTLGGKPYKLAYCLYLPKCYATTNERLPLMVYLHNDEQRNTDQSMVFEWGSSVDPRRDEKQRPPFPMIGLTPQLPDTKAWSDPEVLKMTLALMDEVQKHTRVDGDRIYLTGVQSGGSAAWSLATLAPNRFAAIFPYQGGVVDPGNVAKKLTTVAARVIAPEQDGNAVNAARQMVDALRKSKAEVRIDIVPNSADPNVWSPYYTDPELLEWLMKHRRMGEQARGE